MTTKTIYGPWIDWHGGECPVLPDTVVGIKLRSGFSEHHRHAKRYCWKHDGNDCDIISYRVATEQPYLEAAEQLLLAHGYTVTPPAQPLTFENVVPMTEAPPEGTEYWVVHSFNSNGVAKSTWYADAMDKSALRHRMAYLDKEHALVAARHIFGLKGGEL